MISQTTSGAMGPPRRPPPNRPKPRVQRLMKNVRYCINTGRLFAPPTRDRVLHSRYLLICYGAVTPAGTFESDDLNPVDPSSIICKCSVCCTPANDTYPVTTKTIVAYARDAPPTPFNETHEQWLDPRPAPSVYWSTRSTSAAVLLKWSGVYREMADADLYEVCGYRDVLPKDHKGNPWKRLAIVKRRQLALQNFEHGGLYHYVVRSVDIYGRRSPFSKAASLFLPVE